ncbi:hypothetical protein JD844_024152 [Phrynosoma platyrhinos]|uniref:Uncharacterized protein n=1 Tax=Phrynosoma platyrhinos TaxID=52577 RepID=A0ABQ7SXZ1_PHRPL|nr:hypothetical protein JD844_024152 [Phrynosoma platyrhinos]
MAGPVVTSPPLTRWLGRRSTKHLTAIAAEQQEAESSQRCWLCDISAQAACRLSKEKEMVSTHLAALDETLLEYAEKWKASEDPLPLLEVYTEAIHSYIKAQPYLTSESENVVLVLERIALSYVELLLCLPLELPENKWKEIQSFIQVGLRFCNDPTHLRS